MPLSANYYEPKPFALPPYLVVSKWSVVQHRLTSSLLLKRYWQEIAQLNSLPEPDLTQAESLIQTIARTAQRGRLTQDRPQLYQALVLLRAMSKIHLNMTPYDVQLLCVIAMMDGYLVQLAPGEGKTLTLGLVAVLQAWSGKPCHVITANDYLAKRDAETLLPLFIAAGVQAGAVTQEMSPDQKRAYYAAPIIYSTSKQLLADFLHDKLRFGGMPSRAKLSLNRLMATETDFLMPGIFSVIVDEADSILIDDATTPLIISAPERNELLREAVERAKDVLDRMTPGVHYLLEKDQSGVRFYKPGEAVLVDAMPTFPRLWHSKKRLEDLMFQAIMARDHFKLDQHYVIQEGKVEIVDESTGRVMPGRSWSYGLHQAVETRAGVEMTDPSKTMEKMSFQNFFKLYHHMTGASGTLQNVHEEIYHNYRRLVLNVPPRVPSKLTVQPFALFATRDEKIQALIKRVTELHEQQKPILIGTRRISDSEDLAAHLIAAGFYIKILNAKFHEQEAQIIAQAGQLGRITLATNMAGRGTDIKLVPETLALGGLQVIMFEPHDSARIDWQLFGRAGRQGQPGMAFPLVSLDDEILVKNLFKFDRGLMRLLPLLPLNWCQWATNKFVLIAQQRAQNKAFGKRKRVNKSTREAKERLSFIKGVD